jgi:hypothetical protein
VPVRLRLLAALALLVPLGFATKAYTGPGSGWVRFSLAGVLYEVFWVLLVLALRPTLPPGRVALGVFLATCGLEVLQLWHPPWLQALRGTFLGAALLGSSFSWLDLPHYAVGCAAGALAARALVGRERA